MKNEMKKKDEISLNTYIIMVVLIAVLIAFVVVMEFMANYKTMSKLCVLKGYEGYSINTNSCLTEKQVDFGLLP
jgi:Zn-dependent membrane protease YugP